VSGVRNFLFGGTPGTRRFPEFRPSALDVSEAKRDAFEHFTASTVDSAGGEASYDLPYPKHEYLRWLGRERHVLFHGSPGLRRDRLDPRRSKGTDRAGRQRGVYATPWPLYALWFAVLNRKLPFIWTTNGSRPVSRDDPSERVYWFKVNRLARRPSLLTDGTLYVFGRDGFEPVGVPAKGDEVSDQWVSRGSVTPLVGIPVSPDDFPFSSEVTRS
jgi:hypothetical protein